MDVLANRHAKRTPYRLPPTPTPSQDSEAFGGVAIPVPVTEGSSSAGQGSSRAQQVLRPSGVDAVITLAKDLFRFRILTMNAMWPDRRAFLQAHDELMGARAQLLMQTRER